MVNYLYDKKSGLLCKKIEPQSALSFAKMKIALSQVTTQFEMQKCGSGNLCQQNRVIYAVTKLTSKDFLKS